MASLLWQARLLFLASALGGVLVGIMESEAFRCRRIYVCGYERQVLEDVKYLLSGLGPTSTVLCRSGLLASLARQSPRVASVRVRKKLPQQIFIYVSPRKPAAAIIAAGDRGGWYMLADREGLVYDAVRQAPAGVVQLWAFPATRLHIRETLDRDALAIYTAVVRGIGKGQAPVRKVDFSNLVDIVAFLEDGTKAKIGGLDNLERKFALVGWIWQELKRRGRRAVYVDVRIPSNPTVMLVEAAGKES